MKKGKLFVPFLVLFASLVTLCVTLISGYSLQKIAWILLAVVIFFYIVGSLIYRRVSKFIEANEEKEREEAEKEGAVIEKEAPSSAGSSLDGENQEPSINGRNPDVPGGGEGQIEGGFRERP